MGRLETVLLITSLVKDLLDILSFLWGPISQEIGYIKDLNSNLASLMSETSKLKRRRDECKEDVESAESVGKKRLRHVDHWLVDVDEIVPEVNSIRLEYEQGTANPYSKHRLGKRVIEKLEQVKKLQDKGMFDKLAKRPFQPPFQEMHVPKQLEQQNTSKETLGRITRALSNEENGIICVYGVGGIGKTTLTKAIHDRFIRNGDFDCVIWITVTKDLNLQIIQEKIGKQLGIQLHDQDGVEEKGKRLYAWLRDVRYMLILDDLWQAFILQQVGIPLPNKKNGCKIVITTRLAAVGNAMGADSKINVKPLGRNESWNLFCSKIGDVVLMPEILPIAKRAVRECGGLPLSIQILGQAMDGKDKKEQWENALMKLRGA